VYQNTSSMYNFNQNIYFWEKNYQFFFKNAKFFAHRSPLSAHRSQDSVVAFISYAPPIKHACLSSLQAFWQIFGWTFWWKLVIFSFYTCSQQKSTNIPFCASLDKNPKKSSRASLSWTFTQISSFIGLIMNIHKASRLIDPQEKTHKIFIPIGFYTKI